MDTKKQSEKCEREESDLLFGIISQKQLAWSEHNGRIVDLRQDAVLIETREPVEPGYVWFRRRIGGTRAGFLEWSKPAEDVYCAQVRFVSLSWNVENYVQERARRSMAHIPLRDPAEILGLQLEPREGDPEQ